MLLSDVFGLDIQYFDTFWTKILINFKSEKPNKL